MGAFLDKPLTDKTCDSQEANGMRAYSCSMQGWRITMEDTHVICTSLEGNEETAFYGVFDGHGGTYTSEFCRNRLLPILLSQPEYKGKDTTREDYKTIFRKGFLALDEELKSKQSENDNDRSGSTAITAFVTPQHIIVANCGDSRCILARNGNAISLSTDHKPDNQPEHERISAAGGSVMAGRVNGELAVSRALGDFPFKANTALPPEKQMVSPEPEVLIIDRNEEDQYLMFACDGIWDAIPDPQACVETMNQFLSTLTVELALEHLLDLCLEKNSKDNMTVVLVLFKNAPKLDEKIVEEMLKKKEEEIAA
ncbi:phosphatase 1B [Blastocystis sp. ATCC 50177/Nand II]|uniref:Phosphatase 1B n=1 Tax=Blastocystis sp. subtype 1 (strain ATCC 50177 / NandII) TaxID=478820 RepID=A0A196SJL2_BLAHN|nr:phosphatase 1B [Blastocystis sp. ATCC 50177/Nand II]